LWSYDLRSGRVSERGCLPYCAWLPLLAEAVQLLRFAEETEGHLSLRVRADEMAASLSGAEELPGRSR